MTEPIQPSPEPHEPTFEEVFGFTQPTPEQLRLIEESMMFKINHQSEPVGTQAFLAVAGMQEVAFQIVEEFSKSYARKHSLDPEIALNIFYGGFISAIELFASVRQGVDE